MSRGVNEEGSRNYSRSSALQLSSVWRRRLAFRLHANNNKSDCRPGAFLRGRNLANDTLQRLTDGFAVSHGRGMVMGVRRSHQKAEAGAKPLEEARANGGVVS